MVNVRKPFCMWSLCKRLLKTGNQVHSNTFSLKVCSLLLTIYFCCFLLLFLSLFLIYGVSWLVWWSRKTGNQRASQPSSNSLLCPPILLQSGVGSRNTASPSLVSSIVAVHLLSLCKSEGCYSLRQSHSCSTYPSVEPQWYDEWARMRLCIDGVLVG